MTRIPPGSQQQAPDPAAPDPEQMLHALPSAVALPEPAASPAEPPPQASTDRRSAWTTWSAPIVMLMVMASALTMLLVGRSLQEALTLAAGVTLLGGEIARRTLADAGPAPCLVVAAAVTAFAVVLVVRGYPLDDVTVISGLAGIVAGEVAGRFPRANSRGEG